MATTLGDWNLKEKRKGKKGGVIDETGFWQQIIHMFLQKKWAGFIGLP
jgi:hypothetical protein